MLRTLILLLAAWPVAAAGARFVEKDNFVLVVPDGAASRSKPLVVILHGLGRSHRTLLEDPATREALSMSGSLVLMPAGGNGWWIGEHEQMVLRLIEQVKREHNVSDVTIGGWSMGGFGSLRLAVNYPERFQGWFGILTLADFPNPAYPPEWNREVPSILRPEHNPISKIARLKGKRISFVTGDAAYDRRMNETLSAKLTAEGIPHSFEITAGKHEFAVVRKAIAPAAIVSLNRIWDAAPHNAFTDLVRFGDQWFCVFREGKSHVSPDGSLRVLKSKDGKQWTSAALLSSPRGDLRDAKIVVTPDGRRLQLNGAASLAPPSKVRHQSLVWFSEDGTNWTEEQPVADPDFWLWRVTWHAGRAWGFGYNTNVNRNLRSLRLYSSQDGRRFDTEIADAHIRNSPGENTIRFDRDGAAICLLRRDPYNGDPPIAAADATAFIGTARPPYRDWTWKDTGVRIGGPNFIILPDGRRVAAVRLHDGTTRTSLCWLDEASGTLTEFLPLPSSGDSSYAGLVWHGGLLHVSYYSTHENNRTSIFHATVRLTF